MPERFRKEIATIVLVSLVMLSSFLPFELSVEHIVSITTLGMGLLLAEGLEDREKAKLTAVAEKIKGDDK